MEKIIYALEQPASPSQPSPARGEGAGNELAEAGVISATTDRATR